VEKWCQARKLGIADQVPGIRKKRAAVKITLTAAVLLDPRGRTLLVRQRNGDGALFSRMWQFPALETNGSGSEEAIAEHLRQNFGLTGDESLEPLETARHTVTFRNIRLQPYLVRVKKLPAVKGTRQIALSRIRTLPISNATQKIADAAT
jgi:adenine-specific DNA glycosylase